jgi:hypothetical protein
MHGYTFKLNDWNENLNEGRHMLQEIEEQFRWRGRVMRKEDCKIRDTMQQGNLEDGNASIQSSRGRKIYLWGEKNDVFTDFLILTLKDVTLPRQLQCCHNL